VTANSTAIIIVNYRTADLTIDCLASIAAGPPASPFRVVVVDNASPDDSVAILRNAIDRHRWDEWVTVVPLQTNGGFAYGNNRGIETVDLAETPYVLLLNPDTIVRPGAIDALVNFMDDRPEVGIAGSRLEDPDATPQRSAFRFPSPLGELEAAARLGPISRLLRRWAVAPPPADQPHAADWVAGASMIIRREVLQAVGPLDERYFMYYEEVDFCRRARRAGWPCWYVPDSRVVHLVGQSSGVTDRRRPPQRRPAYWFESRRRYFVKNHGLPAAVAADLLWTAGHLLDRLRCALQRRPRQDPPRLLHDFLHHSTLRRGAAGC